MTEGVPSDLAWQPASDAAVTTGDGGIGIAAVGFRRDDSTQVPVVSQGQWLEIFVRYEATADLYPVNFGIDISDRFDRLLFARGGVNAGIEPIHARSGESVVVRFRINLDLEPGEYILTLTAAEPLRDPASPTGWDQNVGGARYAVVKGAAKIAVLPRSDGVRTHYGQSPLQSEMSIMMHAAEKDERVGDRQDLLASRAEEVR